MLSILIPTYNWDVCPLIADLHGQCVQTGVAFEIRCYEDGSAKNFVEKNKAGVNFTQVVYQVFEKNQGRARIRNRLAADARFPFLLFLDCDSGLAKKDFVATYLSRSQEGRILYGGRQYPKKKPKDKKRLLHWSYGHKRESVAAYRRQNQPYHCFMTNNFLIPKSLFTSIGFDERLLQYGHEDTLFGMQLRERNIPILHLDNPVIHLGIEEAALFLEKNRQAMENLSFLAKQYPYLDTRLLQNVKRMNALKMKGLSQRMLQLFFPFIEKNLLSGKPRLRALDLYKLYYFLYYNH